MRSSVRALAIGAAKDAAKGAAKGVAKGVAKGAAKGAAIGAAIGDGALKIQTHAGGPQGRHFLALPTTLHIPDHP